MATIKQPGVEISQEFITSSPTITTPSLNPVVIGPCYQILEGVDSSNNVNSSALLGSYAQGAGTVAYSLSSLLKSGAIIDEDSIQVYLSTPTVVSLRSPVNETVVFTGSMNSYDAGTGVLTDTGEDFTAEGVLNTDVVRLTFRSEVVDFPISAVGTDTLTLTDQISEDLTTYSFQIIRNNAQFAYQGTAVQANFQFGDETDFLTISTLSTGDYAGAAGDALNLDVKAGIVTSQTSGFYSGTFLFTTAGSGLSALSETTDFLIFDSGGTATGHQIDSVISDKALGLGSAIATNTGKDWAAGEKLNTSGNIDDVAINTSKEGDFSSYFTFTGEVVALVGTTTHFGTSASGVVTFDTSALNSTTPTFTLIIKEEVTDSANGGYSLNKGAAKNLPTSGIAHTTQGILLEASTFGKKIESSGTDLTNKIMAVVSGLSNKQNVAYRIGTASQTLGVALASNGKDLELTLATDSDSKITSTFAEVLAILTNSATSGYVANVSAIYTAAEDGSGGAFNAYGADHGVVDLDGGADASNIILDADLLNGPTGVASVYVGFKALRLDVSDQASTPLLQSFSSITAMTAAIGPVSPDNPLALAMYYMMLNAPNQTVKAIGISATSTNQPDGTTTAYTSALEFLQTKDVYSLVPLTQDTEVLTLVEAHVDSMSSASNKSERIAFINRPFPSHVQATLIASGTSGSTGSGFAGDYLFSTEVDFSQIASFTTALSNGDTMVLVVTGKTDSTSSPTLATGVDGSKYGIRADLGAAQTSQQSSDPFKLVLNSTDVGASSGWVSSSGLTWSLFKIGAALSTTTQKAERVASLGGTYANRRIFLVWPDKATATISGNASILDGYYLGAAWAGKVASQPIGLGFTNMTINGFTGVQNSSDLFSKSQLDDIAGGGVYICMQDTDTSPVKCRHQLSTDVSTVQKRELSITKAVDFVAKFFRDQLTSKIGVFNITNNFLDNLSALCQASIGNLVNRGVIKSGKLVSLEVDSSSPDTVNITLLVGVYYPSNYISLTIQI